MLPSHAANTSFSPYITICCYGDTVAIGGLRRQGEKEALNLIQVCADISDSLQIHANTSCMYRYLFYLRNTNASLKRISKNGQINSIPLFLYSLLSLPSLSLHLFWINMIRFFKLFNISILC